MKVILAPTDFSKTAGNAINYAVQIARRTRATLVLLHVYHLPIVVAEAPVVLPLPEEVEKDCMKQLKRICYRLRARHGRGLNIELRCVEGLAADVICDAAKAQHADLVVVGTHGAGYLEEKLLGSVTSELIARCKVPVLSVACKTKFKSIKKIVLATDYLELSSKALLNPLKEIAGMFRSHIFVLNVTGSSSELPTVSQAVEGVKLEQALSDHDHSFYTEVNKDVVSGISHFMQARPMDLVVMVPRRHSFFRAIFHKRNSKAMSFHTQTPLLTIHN